MPSPIAHCSLFIAIWPTARSRLAAGASKPRRRLLAGAILFGLMAPDVDAVYGLLTGGGIGRFHNGFTNSLFCAPVFGVLFALLCGAVLRCGWRYPFVLGASAYVSHIVLDMLNSRGRGVQLLWPLTDERFASPVPLFVGVIHSVNAPWSVHAITVVNELLFAAGVCVVCSWWRSRQRATRQLER